MKTIETGHSLKKKKKQPPGIKLQHSFLHYFKNHPNIQIQLSMVIVKLNLYELKCSEQQMKGGYLCHL